MVDFGVELFLDLFELHLNGDGWLRAALYRGGYVVERHVII